MNLDDARRGLLVLLERRGDQTLDTGVDCQRCGDVVPQLSSRLHLAFHVSGRLPTLPVRDCLARNAIAYEAFRHRSIAKEAEPALCARL